MSRCFSLPHSRMFGGRGIQAARPIDPFWLAILPRRQSTRWNSSIPSQSLPQCAVTVASRDTGLRLPWSMAPPESYLNVHQSSPHVVSYALYCLRKFITALDSGSLPVHTPDAIISFYHTAKAQSELYFLSEGDFNALISFYGSLSALPLAEVEHWNASSTFRLHPTTFAYDHENHWTFVLKLVNDMDACGRTATVLTRFWQLRATLAKFKALQNTPDVRDRHRVMTYARVTYRHIRDVTSNSNVHFPWLSALLSLGTVSSLNEALSDCTRLIRRAREIDEKLQTIMWRIVSANGAVALKEAKIEFCIALRQRFTANVRGQQHPAPWTIQNPPVSVEDLFDLNVLQNRLATTLFSYGSLNPDDAPYLHGWAVHEVRNALKADLPSLWRQLCISAVAHSFCAGFTEHTPLPPIQLTGKHQSWNLISALLLLRATCCSERDAELLRGGARILRTLWQAWLALTVARTRKQPLVVERAMWLAFIHTAGFVKDIDLLTEICNVESFKSCLVPPEPGPSTFPTSLCEAASVAIAAAATACSVRSWNTVLCYLESAHVWHEELALRRIVAGVFIREWAMPGREVEVAFKLYQSATSFELVSSNTIHVVARACLRNGLVREVFVCLGDPAFRDAPRTRFVGTLLRLMRARGVRELPKDMANVLGGTMKDMVNSPAMHIHARSWEWGVSVIGQSECAPLAVDIALAHAERHPLLGSRRWWTTFVHQLCNVRFFRSGLRLVRDMPESHIARRAMCLALVRRLGNAKVHRLAWQARRWISPGRIPSRIKLLELVDFRGRSPRYQDSLAILPFLFPSGGHRVRHLSSKAYIEAIRLLGRVRRRNAVERIYMRTKESDPAFKTRMANTFLSAMSKSSRKRNDREIRCLLKLLNRLIVEDGLIPDRVTLNIILRALLRWSLPLDARKLRVLFDRVIDSGFPAPRLEVGAAADQGVVKAQLPVGKHAARIRQPRPLIRGLPSPDGPVEFVEHVRPLYKMFLKAFRNREDWDAAWTVLQTLARAKNQIEEGDGDMEN